MNLSLNFFRTFLRMVRVALTAAILFPGIGCEFQSSTPTEVQISSNPDGAFLMVNGKEVGRTPYYLKQPVPGKYVIQLKKEGYEPLDQILEISKQTAPEIPITLKRIKGLVLLETVPPGAEVSVNGAFRGKTPLLVTDLPTATTPYKVSFILQGFDPRESEFTLTDRIPMLRLVNMRSNYATIKFDSKPPGASVILDGIHKGQTPCSVDNVLVGNHTFNLTKDGYKPHQGEIKLTLTGTFPIFTQLEEKLAVLEVISTPPDAKVSLNDEFKGRTNLQIGGLRDGKYTVTIERPSYEKIVKIVEIKNAVDAKVDEKLEKATGILALNIIPSGSNVVIDSEQKGVSAEGPLNLELLPGSYIVEIGKTGYLLKTIKVDIEIRKTTTQDVKLKRLFKKDRTLLLKNGRFREGMLIKEYPNGDVRLETREGIFEDFTADEIRSSTPIKE